VHALSADVPGKRHGDFVSHDASAVVNLCQRAILLEHGVKKLEGDAKSVSEAYVAVSYDLPARQATGHESPPDVVEMPDVRQDVIARSQLRNDIEVFKFDPQRAGFGDGSARICTVRLLDPQGHPLSWVVGGELVRLEVIAEVKRPLCSPIIGFFLKDRLGQRLFGDNTYLSYQARPVAADAGQMLQAGFEFRMPILPMGHYSFDVAIAEGTQVEHTQADWVHDALVLESHSSSASTGLVGIPMRAIDLATLEHA
jgi:lipopolysaccharide transport system ATP-binding protein